VSNLYISADYDNSCRSRISVAINRLTFVTWPFGLEESAARVVFAKRDNNIIDSQTCALPAVRVIAEKRH
jgi:hypothetical protein